MIYVLILLLTIFFIIQINILDNFDNNKFLKQQLEINKGKHKIYMRERKQLNDKIKNYNEKNKTQIEFGPNVLLNTDKNTLGFCPYGQYYNKKNTPFTGEIKDLENCQDCTKCNSKPGWYLASGCLGDKDSVCEFKKLPLFLNLEGHKKNGYFHESIPQHTHKLINGKTSQINHLH